MATDADQLSPPTPPPAPAPSQLAPSAPMPGDLTPGWHKVTLALWLAVMLALAAVWSASVQLGLSTWWLGPRGDRNPPYIQLLPFMPPLVLQILTLLGARWTALYGTVAGVLIVVIGLFDFSHVTGFAWLEVAIGGAAIVVSLASLTGTYRRRRD